MPSNPRTDAKIESARTIPLSKRQRECLQGVAEHLDSQQIAHRLGISPHTVDNHIAAAIKVLGAKSRRDAVKRIAEMTGQSLTSQFPPVDREAPAMSADHLSMPLQEERSSFEVATPAIKDRTEMQNDQVKQDPLRTIALIAAVAASLVILLLAMDPLVQSAARLANAIDPP